MFFIDQSGIQKEGLIEVNLAICHMSSKYKNKVIPDSLVPSEPPAATACNQESSSTNPEDQHMLALSPDRDRRTLTWRDPWGACLRWITPFAARASFPSAHSLHNEP